MENNKEVFDPVFSWDDYPQAVRTRIPIPKLTLRTERQWALSGYVANDKDCGRELWSNAYLKHRFVYLFPNEVHRATKEELDAYWEPFREERRERERQNRQRKKQEQQNLVEDLREADSKISVLEQQMEQNLNRSMDALQQLTRKLCEVSLPQLQPLPSAKSVVVDCETTGLYWGDNELLQVSIISAEDDTVLYHSYLKPLYYQAWESAQVVNNISPEMVQDAPTLLEEAPKIRSILEQAEKIICYDLHFNLNFFKFWLGYQPSDEVQRVDVMGSFAYVYGDWDITFEDYRWQPLSTCAKYYHYEWEGNRHDSLSDCRAILFCYRKLNENNATE